MEVTEHVFAAIGVLAVLSAGILIVFFSFYLPKRTDHSKDLTDEEIGL